MVYIQAILLAIYVSTLGSMQINLNCALSGSTSNYTSVYFYSFLPAAFEVGILVIRTKPDIRSVAVMSTTAEEKARPNPETLLLSRPARTSSY